MTFVEYLRDREGEHLGCSSAEIAEFWWLEEEEEEKGEKEKHLSHQR